MNFIETKFNNRIPLLIDRAMKKDYFIIVYENSLNGDEMNQNKNLLFHRKEQNNQCNLSEGCLDIMSKPRQRGYMLTHQVLYFQIIEKVRKTFKIYR